MTKSLRYVHASLIFVISAVFFIQSCNKPPFDYRNKWCGSYFFTIENQSWTLSSGGSSATEYYNGYVRADSGDPRNKIRIKFQEGPEWTFEISRQGNLLKCSCGDDCGKFEKNKVTFGDRNCSGRGGGFNTSVTGIKKSKK
jgi:hypothetical protein